MKNYQNLLGFSDRVYGSLDDLLHQTYGFNIDGFSTEDFVSGINCPVLLIHSQEDLVVSYDSVHQIALKSPNATVYESKTGGHSLHTPEVVEQILAFL
jgi:pimeloyl-ACP methyl ester carboxylesterase